MRRLFVILVSAWLSLVGLGVAQAAPSAPAAPPASLVEPEPSPPSAPRSVRVVGLERQGLPRHAVRVSWRRPETSGSDAIRSYVVRLRPAAGTRPARRLRVPATRTSVTFHGLRFGSTYRIKVRAVSRAGRSPAARLRYTLPRPAPAWVFAVQKKSRSIVRVPVAGGAVTTIAARRTAWDVDAAGNVYVLDRSAGTVTRWPADRSSSTTIVKGLSDPTDLQLDAAGNVYVVDGRRVIRTSSTGGGRRVVAQPVFYGVAVAPDGTVTTVSDDFDLSDGQHFGVHVLSYPAGGGPVTRRPVRFEIAYHSSGPGELLTDGAGDLFLHFYETGGGGFSWWSKVAPGATTAVPLWTRRAYEAVAVDARDRFHLVETHTFCDDISENEGACTPDLTVDEVLTDPAAGARMTRRIDPFQLQRTGTGVELLTGDRRGRLFLAQSEGRSAGLWKFRRGDGTRHRLASGAYLEPRRNN